MNRNITIDERPAYIASRVIFPDATVDEIKKPARIQSIQASLACTLRTPLEDIRITGIKVDGVPIDIAPALYALSSNGTIECYKIPVEGVRRLQATGVRGSVAVDYTIANPPDQVLALSPDEFATVVRSSPAMTEVAQSVGSSGVEALAVETAVTAQPPEPRSFLEAYVGGGVGGGVLLLAIGSIVGYVLYRKRRVPVASPPSTMVEAVNPLHSRGRKGWRQTAGLPSRLGGSPMRLPLGRGSVRILFAPTQVRNV